MSINLEVKQLRSLDEVPAGDWNALSDGANPFVTHEYLYGLEQYRCLDEHGWYPAHLCAYAGESLIGALPLYLRSNSFGEFVFDWAWADAYERAGGRYYPKLVSAIPFAPVLGPRLLVRNDCDDPEGVRDRLLERALEQVQSEALSSLHFLFAAPPDHAAFERAGLMSRLTCQFHWHNRGYRDFQDFLDSLNSKRRKQIRRERRQVQDHGIEIEVLSGDQVSDAQWRVFFDFYCSTFYRRWGEPRLTLAFFHSLSRTLPQRVLLILARHAGDYVAGAFAMLGADTVYGRHWGCGERFPFLHFELCYYQTIDFCIRNGLAVVDAGVQGEHKLLRGFEPVAAHSWHWIRHSGFRRAVDDYLARESSELRWYMDNLSTHTPYKAAG